MEKTLNIKGMMCEHCKAHVTKALSSLDGVSSVDVDLEKGVAKVSMEKDIDDSVFEKAIIDAGYEYVK
ncbi:MAG: heavy-metal-associated domain-containing protein [Selenomonadaceae bacterium]|nr:heavy-metal-associated domain-containing protein [Selenomonadaceae bacterium]